MYSWVDAVQAVSQYATVSNPWASASRWGDGCRCRKQPAHYQYVGNQGAEFLHETLAEGFAVVGGIACAYDAQDVPAVQVGRAL